MRFHAGAKVFPLPRFRYLIALLFVAILFRPSAAQGPAAIVAHADPYKSAWRHEYPWQVSLEPRAVADHEGTLWLLTITGKGVLDFSLSKIGPDGRQIANYPLAVPLGPKEWVGYWTPAVSGHRVAVLASLASGGKDQIFEGAWFIPMETDSFGKAVRVATRGPQFPTMIGTGPGEFIAAGDQDPLTLLKLSDSGAVVWRHAFSSKLVLPAVSVAPSGSIFVLSQGGPYILLQVLDSNGHELRSRRISARQGTVSANPAGGCSLLFTTGLGGEKNKVHFMTLDDNLREVSQAETPLVGWGGRTYQLMANPRGYLIVGEAPGLDPQSKSPIKVLAELDKSGAVLWKQTVSSVFAPLLVPFPSGFYVVSEPPGSKGVVEKYLY